MAKKNQPTIDDFIAELKKEFDRYEYYLTIGGNDPNWADGVNMNLIRNHIIINKRLIKEYCENNSCDLPKEYFIDTPDVVSDEFMANPDEIRKTAKSAVHKLQPYYDKLYEESKLLSSKQKEDNNVNSVLGYYTRLLSAIDNDDLVTMRLYKNHQTYIEAFVSKSKKVKTSEYEPVQPVQLSFF